MLCKERLGLEIKKRRKSRNLTQLQLAKGICDQSEISRIEKGVFFPSIDVLFLISNKLKVPISYFFDILSEDELEENQTIRKKVRDLSLAKNYKELSSYIEELLRNKALYHPEMKKFLVWQKHISAYYSKKIDLQYCLTELRLLLKDQVLGQDMLLDKNIKNSIANLLAENQKYEESISIYKEILNDYADTQEFDKLKVKVNYNYGKLLYLTKRYSCAFEATEAGISISKSIGDVSLLGQLYYQKGAIMEELNHVRTEISEVYRKASFLFEILDLSTHKKILEEHKGNFLKEAPLS